MFFSISVPKLSFFIIYVVGLFKFVVVAVLFPNNDLLFVGKPPRLNSPGPEILLNKPDFVFLLSRLLIP